MMLKMTNRLIKAEAERRGWKVIVVDRKSGMLRYISPKGGSMTLISSMPETTTAVQELIARSKPLFYRLSEKIGVNVPNTFEHITDTHSAKALHKYDQLVVKPADAAHGDGVTTDIDTKKELVAAVERASESSDTVLVQEQALGHDYRLLFIGGQYVASSIRHPAQVTGDGKHSIEQLIELENKSEKRGKAYESELNEIDMGAALVYLGQRGLQDVPQEGQDIQVVGVSNIGVGGFAEDTTNTINPELIHMGQKIVDGLGIDVCGVDIMSNGKKHWVIEVNACPSFGLHKYPFKGEARHPEKIMLDWLEHKIDNNDV